MYPKRRVERQNTVVESSNAEQFVPNYLRMAYTISLGWLVLSAGLNWCFDGSMKKQWLIWNTVSVTSFSIALWLASKLAFSSDVGRGLLTAFLFQNSLSLLNTLYIATTVSTLDLIQGKVMWITILVNSLCILAGLAAVRSMYISAGR